MRLAERCRNSFSTLVRQRGDLYCREGHVQGLEVLGSTVTARVQGSEREPYTVQIAWQPRGSLAISASCECQHFRDGDLCKHIWATLVAAGRQPGVHGPEGNKAVDVRANYKVVEGAAQVREELKKAVQPPTRAVRNPSPTIPAPPLSRRAKAVAKQPVPKPPSPWRRQLDIIGLNLKQYEFYDTPQHKANPADAWYAVDMQMSAESGSLVIQIYYREKKKSGTLGKLKPYARKPIQPELFPDPEDRFLVEALLGCDQATDDSTARGYYRYDSRFDPGDACRVVPPLYDTLLPRLAATGRWVLLDNEETDPANVLDAPRLTWEPGPPLQSQIFLAPTTDRRGWMLGLHLSGRDWAERYEGKLRFVEDGLVIFPDRIAPARLGPVLDWLSALDVAGQLFVPNDEVEEFVERLYQMPKFDCLSLPAKLSWEQVVHEPRPKITIKSHKGWRDQQQLLAKVSFLYGEHEITATEPQEAILQRAARQVVRRDRAAEEKLCLAVHSVGFRTSPYRYGANADYRSILANPKKLPDAVAKLSRLGWVVEAEGKLIRQAGAVRLSVATNVDWFDLRGSIAFGDEEIQLPAILAALRKGAEYVTLGDGSQGMLPEEWLKKLGAFAALGTESEDSVRFRPSQAMLLDALLAAQENSQVDAGFELCRERWRGFAGVKPQAPPDGFQGKLRHYQEEGLGWLRFLEEFQLGGCLADDMGLGKTIQVLALLEGRRAAQPKGATVLPSLVVVPKSLVFNWIEEAARFTPELRVLNYTGLGRRGAAEQQTEFDLVITTYGTLRKDIAALKDVEFDYAILDEAQAIKNPNSLSAKACRLIRAKNRLALSGTPVENRLSDLWSLFEFLNPGMLGRSTTFQALASSTDPRVSKKRTKVRPTDDDGDVEISDDEEYAETPPESTARSLLSQALRPLILRRTKKQVLTELPERTEKTIHCEMEPGQRKIYDELRDFYRQGLGQRVSAQGWNKSKMHVLEALLRLRQAACHPGLIDPKYSSIASAKLDSLLEQVEELISEGHKALIFSQFTSLLAILKKKLDKLGIVYEYLDGQTNKRQDHVRRFQDDPNCPLFLISLKAGGHGLNLTAADYVFILDPWWNPAVEAQAIDRAYRIGQTRNVFANRLICTDTVEEKILELQKSKRDLADAIVSEDNSLLAGMTPEDLQLLLS